MVYYRRRYPYRRPYRRRYPYGARRRYYKKKQTYNPNSAMSTAKQALRLGLKLAKAVNVEYKHFDSLISGTIDYASPATGVLNACPQGDTDVTRDGDSIKCQSLALKLNLAANTVDAKVRVMIIWDQQNTWSTIGDYLDQTGANAVIGNRHWDKRFNYRTLYDRTFILDTSAKDTGIYSIKLPIGLHTQFENGTANINSGALRIIMTSDQTSSNLPTYTYNARLVYTDN